MNEAKMSVKKLTKARAKELFSYNSAKRELTWNRGRGKVKAGDIAGAAGCVKVDNVVYDLKDIICIWVHGVTLEELECNLT